MQRHVLCRALHGVRGPALRSSIVVSQNTARENIRIESEIEVPTKMKDVRSELASHGKRPMSVDSTLNEMKIAMRARENRQWNSNNYHVRY